MLAWIQTNLATLIVSLVILFFVASVIYSMIRAKKRGKSSCGCDGCSGCAMAGSCHPKQ